VSALSCAEPVPRPIEVLAKLRAARSNRAIAALENAEVE